MQHRDMITIQKVISEMQIGIDAWDNGFRDISYK